MYFCFARQVTVRQRNRLFTTEKQHRSAVPGVNHNRATGTDHRMYCIVIHLHQARGRRVSENSVAVFFTL